jgi:hypothetical protein
MNDSYAFFLCSTKQLKIFDLKAFALVKVIETNADQIQMFSDNSFALFDSANRIVDKYDQSDEFKKVECFDLARSFERGFQFSVDNTDHFTFYNPECAMFITRGVLDAVCTYADVDPSLAEPSEPVKQQERGERVKNWIGKLQDYVPDYVFFILLVMELVFIVVLLILFFVLVVYLVIYLVYLYIWTVVAVEKWLPKF